MSSNKSNYCAISRTVAVVVTAILLISSIFSCNNPLSGTDSGDSPLNQKTGTISGKLTFNGAIPLELIKSSANSTNTKTAFPTVASTEYDYVISLYDPMNQNPFTNVTTSFNDDHTEYTLKGVPLEQGCTVEVNVYSGDSQTTKVLTGKTSFTLTQENPIVSADIVLEPIQTVTSDITRSVNLLIQVDEDSGVGYVEAAGSKFTCIENSGNYTLTLVDDFTLSKSEPQAVTVNFYSGTATDKGILLYTFTETINIFDNLETNTWVKNSDGKNSDPYLVLRDGESFIADCKITKDLVSHFQNTTFYVDTTVGSSTETGTFSNPFTTLQNAVDHINSYGNTTDKYTIYIKNDIDFESRILFIQNNQEIRNITIAGYDGVKKIKRTSNCNYTLFEFSKESYNITLRDLILDGNDKNTNANGGAIRNSSNLTLENVTIQNFICTNTNSAGGAIYNGGTLTLKKSKILNCTSKNDSGTAYGGTIYNAVAKTVILDDVVISGCKTQADAASKESYGGGIYNAGTCKINKAIITGCSTTSTSENYAKGGAIYNSGTLVLGDSVCNSDGSPDVTIGIGTYNGTEYSTPNEAFAGAGVYSDGNGSTPSFTMNKDCVIGKYNPTDNPTEASYGNCSLSSSMLGNGGAGVWLYKTNLTINGGFISYNYAKNTYAVDSSNSITGVGLCCQGNGTTEINNLIISYNKAEIGASTGHVAGVGISINSMEQIQLNNVKVYNNSGTPTDKIFGKGIYISDSGSSIILQNSFWCSEDNDIYFNVSGTNHRQIQVDSILNPQNQFGVPQQYAATITPGDYESISPYLFGIKIAENKDKFKVTENGTVKYFVNPQGKFFIPIGTKYPAAPYEVGDIVFNDGSATPYSVIAARNPGICSDAEKAAAIAVIFRVGDGTDGNKTLGVGIKQEKKVWCINDANGHSFKFSTSSTDGSNNLFVIASSLQENNDTGVSIDGSNYSLPAVDESEGSDYLKLKTNYPAFEFAYYYGKKTEHNTYGTDYENGWYLPSTSELEGICNEKISDALEAVVGVNLTEQYWSSCNSYSQVGAYEFDLTQMKAVSTDKKIARNTLAVRAFD